ncbi:GNAT family N-acetyltransferase [Ideonella sp. YS5]|uniref:GNAT family N-acetyltransferase n=1 Tax=Ideonella sp. YS5 TaxID=3453714 RepID=UPI003EE93F90
MDMADPSMPIRLRPAQPSDIAEIQEFDEFNGDRLREVEAGTCFVAVSAGKVIAYASYEPRGLLGQPLLTYLCVCDEFRRQGIATSLVSLVQSQASGRKLLSSTEDWCAGTQRIFEHLGWQKVGEIAGVNKDGSSEWFYAVDLGS